MKTGQARVKFYRINYLDGTGSNVDFTPAQAAETVWPLESDGIAIAAAIALVKGWNAMADRQGRGVRYSIPFIKGL